MAEQPTLTPEKREGFLGEFGLHPTGSYEVGAEGEEAVATEEPESQGATEETPAEPVVAEEPQAEEPVAEEAAAEEPAAEPATEEVSDLDYLNSLMQKPEEEAPAASGLSLEQVQQLLELSKGRISEAREEPSEAPGETIDLDATDWTAEGVQRQIQESLERHEGDPARAMGEILNNYTQIIQSKVVKPGLGSVEAKFQKQEEARKMEAEYAASWQNLASVPITIQEQYPGTMEATVTKQFAEGLRDTLTSDGDSNASRAKGLSRSLLGQHILKNPKLALTQEGVMEAVLTVAGGARLRKRGGQPQVVMTGTRQEVSGALSKAHGIEPSTKKGEDLSEEDQILSDIDKAAEAHRVRVGKNVFFPD